MHVFSSLAEDIEGFAARYGGDVEFVRLAGLIFPALKNKANRCMQMADKIVLRSVESLIPYARNARTHSDVPYWSSVIERHRCAAIPRAKSNSS